MSDSRQAEHVNKTGVSDSNPLGETRENGPGVIARVWQRFTSFGKTEPDLFDFETFEHKALDLDLLAEELKLDEKAKINGSANVPASKATSMDGPQMEP
jgi:hypothetical protein